MKHITKHDTLNAFKEVQASLPKPLVAVVKDGAKTYVAYKKRTQTEFHSHEYGKAEIVDIIGGGSAPEPLCFENVDTSASSVAMQNHGGNAPVLYYSRDKKTWTLWNYSALSLGVGEKIYVKGLNPNGVSLSLFKYSNFVLNKKTACSGNVQSLFSMNNNVEYVPNYCYTSLFSGCTSLTTAPALPATTLASNCYQGMFSDCTSLATTPALPATTLEECCYANMFNGCTNIVYITSPIACANIDVSSSIGLINFNSVQECVDTWIEGASITFSEQMATILKGEIVTGTRAHWYGNTLVYGASGSGYYYYQ